MKIRKGFVSNSSSSSFIVIGVATDDKTKVEGLDLLYIEGKTDFVKGIIIADSGMNDELDDISISFDKLQEHAKKVSELLEIDISKVKLIAGIRPC